MLDILEEAVLTFMGEIPVQITLMTLSASASLSAAAFASASLASAWVSVVVQCQSPNPVAKSLAPTRRTISQFVNYTKTTGMQRNLLTSNGDMGKIRLCRNVP